MAQFKLKQDIFCRARYDLKWYKSRINKVGNNANGKNFCVHYYGWSNKYDEWYTEAEALESFKDFNLENARFIQDDAVEELDLPLYVYTMKKLGFPNEPQTENFSQFLEEYPEALQSKTLKKHIIRKIPPASTSSSASSKSAWVETIAAIASSESVLNEASPVISESAWVETVAATPSSESGLIKTFATSESACVDDSESIKTFPSVSKEVADNAFPVEQNLSVPLEDFEEDDIPMDWPEQDKQNVTVHELVEDALTRALPFMEFVDYDVELCKQNCFARLPARITIVEILDYYLESSHEDEVENRHILADCAFQMFNHFALSKLFLPHEEPYVLGVLNLVREGKSRQKFPSMVSEIPLKLNIFGFTHLFRLVRFAFNYYKDTPEEENNEEFRKLIKSWAFFARFLKKCRRQFFDEKVDYVRISYSGNEKPSSMLSDDSIDKEDDVAMEEEDVISGDVEHEN